ncbi:MAG: DUF1289 domain-containing protein [Alphaproteobacteria bacterium]|nr:MAG: DUF1289 domain-containing protein [Alphaproteobacteria bacterium]
MSVSVDDFFAVESPCIGICKLDSSGVYCTGCFRTRQEIGRWSMAPAHEKRAIVAAAAARQERLAPRR